MNGNLIYVLLMSLFAEWGWDIEQLKNYTGTVFIFFILGGLVVGLLNWRLNLAQARQDADPRNQKIPKSPEYGTWNRVIGVYAENVSWMVSLSVCYLFFLMAYDTDSIRNTQTMDEWGCGASNRLVIIYTVLTILFSVTHIAWDTHHKEKRGFFSKNKAKMEESRNPLQQGIPFEVTMGSAPLDACADSKSDTVPSAENVPSAEGSSKMAQLEAFVARWRLCLDNFRMMIQTVHGIMLVQWVKDNKQVFRQGLGGVVGETPTYPTKDECGTDSCPLPVSSWNECCLDALDAYTSRQNNQTTLGDLYVFWLVIFGVVFSMLMIPKLMKWYTDSKYDDSKEYTIMETQHKSRYFIGRLSETFNGNWNGSAGFVFAKVTQALINQYIKPANGGDPALRFFFLAAALSISVGALADVFKNMNDWQKQNIEYEDFVDDDDDDDFALESADPLGLRIELDEMKAEYETRIAKLEQALELQHCDVTKAGVKTVADMKSAANESADDVANSIADKSPVGDENADDEGMVEAPSMFTTKDDLDELIAPLEELQDIELTPTSEQRGPSFPVG